MKAGTPNFIGEKLTEAREGRGIKQVELANILGVARQVVSQYENNLTTPSPDVFDKIIELLRFPAHFYLIKSPSLLDREPFLYRSLKSASSLDKRRAERRLSWVASLTSYTSEYVDFPPLDFPAGLLEALPADPRQLTDITIDAVANELRSHWNLKQAPVPHVIRLLESKGFAIALDNFEAPKIDALSVWSSKLEVPFILLNRDMESGVRLRFNAIHEAGELIFHRFVDPDLLANKGVVDLLDKQAHRFAGAFLLPEEAFLSDLYSPTLDGLLQLKRKWKVSVAMMIKRLQQLDFLTEEEVGSLFKNLSRRGWRKFEPYDDQISIEEPVLLKQAFEVIVEEGFQSAFDLLYHTAFDKQTVSELANLPDGFFGQANLDGKLVNKKEVVEYT